MQGLVSGLRLERGVGGSSIDSTRSSAASSPSRSTTSSASSRAVRRTSAPGCSASVFMHLPGLVLTKEISARSCRGSDRWASPSAACTARAPRSWATSSRSPTRRRWARAEEDLVDHLDKIARQVIQYELQARQVLLRDARGGDRGQDLARVRPATDLRRSLSFEELMNLLSAAFGSASSLNLLPEPPGIHAEQD